MSISALIHSNRRDVHLVSDLVADLRRPSARIATRRLPRREVRAWHARATVAIYAESRVRPSTTE